MTTKYNLSVSDLDILLYLYDEPYFKKSKAEKMKNTVRWDKGQFARLVKDGWIDTLRPRNGRYGARYMMSFKARKTIASMYKVLAAEQKVSETKRLNPMYAENATYTDKVNRPKLEEMNKSILQRLSESL